MRRVLPLLWLSGTMALFGMFIDLIQNDWNELLLRVWIIAALTIAILAVRGYPK